MGCGAPRWADVDADGDVAETDMARGETLLRACGCGRMAIARGGSSGDPGNGRTRRAAARAKRWGWPAIGEARLEENKLVQRPRH